MFRYREITNVHIIEMKSDSYGCIQLVIDARTKVPDKL